MPDAVLPSFAKGEIDPGLHGRVDTAAYQVGLAQARNVIINSTGGAMNRPGSLFVGPVKDHLVFPRLIEFQFKTSDQYILEFGDQYMRVIRDDGHVLETATTITGATQANPVVVTTSAAHGYANGDEVYISGVVGMTEINNQRFTLANITATTFELTHQVDDTNIDGTAFTAYSSGGTAEKIFEITTPYDILDVDFIKFTQSADVMTLVHPDYTPRELSRTDHDAWTLSEINFIPTIDHPTSVAITVNTAGTDTVKYFVTAIDADTGEEGMPGLSATTHTVTGVTQADPGVVTTSAAHNLESGDIVHIDSVVGMTELNNRHFTVGAVTGTTFEMQNEDTTTYTAYSSAGTVTDAFDVDATSATTTDNTITWVGVAGAAAYNVYRRFNDGVIGFIGESVGLSFEDDDIAADESSRPPQPRNPFVGTDNQPGAVGYYEQRRVFGGSNNNPDTVWYSKTAAHSNMSVSSPNVPTDAITTALASRKVNEIRHFAPGGDLLIFTSGSEWRVNSGQDVGFSADTLFQQPQTNWGSGHLEPIIAGDVVIFMMDSGAQIRSIGFELQKDKYTGENLTQLATHLLEQYVAVDWTYTKELEGRVYIVRSDGKIVTMTFNPSQEVIAFTTWDTDGLYESIAALEKQASSTEDAVYYCVNRTVNALTVRYIERTQSRIFTDVEDAIFMDSALSLDAPFTITDVTAANPVVVTTSAAHGFVNGDEVAINGIVWESDVDATFNETQPAQLNGFKFIVANKTATTFELTSIEDGTDIDGSAYNAYVRAGEVRATVTAISGLRHLQGRDVVILADGNVISNLTVSATGTLTLPNSASRVHVGLRYISDIETLNIESPEGTVQGAMKKIARVIVRFKKSRGLFTGPDSDNLIEMKQREFELMGAPTALLTGDKEIRLKPSWNTNGRIFLRQKDPLPLHVLAIMPDISLGD
jgi:hypothetical protein